MARPVSLNSALEFDALRLEGALFSPDHLHLVARMKADAQTEQDYEIPPGLKIRDEVGRAFRIGLALWDDFVKARTRADRPPHEAAQHFVTALLTKAFGFTDLAPVPVQEVGGRRYPIGYLARGRVPVVIAPHALDLDAGDALFADTRRRSATQLAQEYLNASSEAAWAIVSNGGRLRLMGDSTSLTRPAYLEADLERLFGEESFADFSALWLTLHASRFGSPGTPGTACPLQAWRRASAEQGSAVRRKLRDGVTEALLVLGNGFLQPAGNGALRDALHEGRLSSDAYFQQLLRLVYRLIFLFTVEDRGLLHPPGAGLAAQTLYRDGYSMRRLRQRALRRAGADRHADLWEGLVIVFRALARGEPALALPALGGLYAETQCPDLDAAQLPNRALVEAVQRLGWFRDVAALVRVRYTDMGTEELGSVYESLLELVPEIDLHARRFGFVGMDAAGDAAASVRGNARKLTGSYYTPDSLVQQLLKTALDPVIEARLAANPQQPVQALLGMTIIDPACGSGHFLLSAARRVAERVALLRTDGHPRVDDYRHALRDVISHCVFGVDRNPMALELARMALWLEAYTPDAPLTFIDHHLVCGDALLGLLDFDVLADGIPDAAFKPLAGDAADTVRDLARRNRAALRLFEQERRQGALPLQPAAARDALAALDTAADDTLPALAAKEAAWRTLAAQQYASPLAQAADVAVAAFLLPKPAGADVPTSETLYHLLHGTPQAGDAARVQAAQAAARAARVLHWPIAFAQVMARGGFDVVLGNPPWEVSQLNDEEFFASRDPEIARLAGDERKQAIAALPERNPRLAQEFQRARFTYDATNTFIRAAQRFALTAYGKLNTYALFTETASRLLGPTGRAGVIVPTGIATDDSTKVYFEAITQQRRLVALYSFENEEFVFPAVHHAMKFALLTTSGEGDVHEAARLAHFARQVEWLSDERRIFILRPEEFRLINPNTRTCPVFRSQADAELAKKLYSRCPVLWQEVLRDPTGEVIQPEVNPWGLRFKQGLFNMTSDSGLFKKAPGAGLLPLYEAKLIHQFDHRWATFLPATGRAEPESRDVTAEEKADPSFAVRPRYWVEEREVLLRLARLPDFVLKALRKAGADAQVLALRLWAAGHLRAHGERKQADALLAQVAEAPAKARTELGLKSAPLPDLADGLHAEAAWPAAALERLLGWGKTVSAKQLDEFLDVLLDQASPRWLMGWRDITNATNERTVIAAAFSRTAVGHTLPMILMDSQASAWTALAANLNAMPLDYIARQKVGGTHLTYGFVKQFPVLSPADYSQANGAFIVPRALELSFTANDLKPFYDEVVADDASFDPRSGRARGQPFVWDPQRRAQLRAELDAYYARLYGLTRDELRFILDPKDVLGPDYPSETFRVLRDNEIRQFGEYRTRRLVLEAWDKQAAAGGAWWTSLLG